MVAYKKSNNDARIVDANLSNDLYNETARMRVINTKKTKKQKQNVNLTDAHSTKKWKLVGNYRRKKKSRAEI